uniref:Uncharacterized protein n=1 Tax=Opuntia streptacantha TaxID=393608 RepID=A0A7C9EE44_OPUST
MTMCQKYHWSVLPPNIIDNWKLTSILLQILDVYCMTWTVMMSSGLRSIEPQILMSLATGTSQMRCLRGQWMCLRKLHMLNNVITSVLMSWKSWLSLVPLKQLE